MILSRLISFILRFAEFVCAAVVLGLAGHFVHVRRRTDVGPLGREIYTLVVACVSVLLSLVWLLPFTASMMHYPMDFFISAAWFAAFGALVNWIHKINCGNAFNWSGITGRTQCGQWKAAEAFSFLSACFWLASALLSFYVFHKVTRAPATVDAAPRRRRWGRRSAV